jgi:phosphoglycolate/pyridoxal phosphate phosphatase family enzyme
MKGIILDIDGVLRRGSEVVPGSLKAVSSLIDGGLELCYLTNNSTRTRDDLLSTLTRMGFPQALVVSSAQAAAVHITRKYGSSKCLVVGEEGLEEELELEGHKVVRAGEARGSGPEFIPNWSEWKKRAFKVTMVDHVVAGLDRYFTFSRLADALWAIRGGANFIATNTDPTLPYEDGKVLPGAGTIIAAIREGSGTEPFIVGKPHPFSTELALDLMGFKPQEVLMVGDRVDTDIAAGKAAGCRVAMVLTGDVEAPERPDFPIYRDLLELSREIM